MSSPESFTTLTGHEILISHVVGELCARHGVDITDSDGVAIIVEEVAAVVGQFAITDRPYSHEDVGALADMCGDSDILAEFVAHWQRVPQVQRITDY